MSDDPLLPAYDGACITNVVPALLHTGAPAPSWLPAVAADAGVDGVFTATTDPTELRDVLDAGADGIVLKEGGLPELLSALDAVLAGRRYVSPQLASEL